MTFGLIVVWDIEKRDLCFIKQLPTFGCKKNCQQLSFTSQTPQFIDRRKWFQEESASADCGRTDGLMGVAGNGCGNIPTATRLTLELNLRPINSANNQTLQFLIPPCRIPIHWHKPWFHSPLPWIEPPSHSLPIPLTRYKSPWLNFAQVQSTYTSLSYTLQSKTCTIWITLRLVSSHHIHDYSLTSSSLIESSQPSNNPHLSKST